MSQIEASLVVLLVVAGTMAAVPAGALTPGIDSPGGDADVGPAATNGSTPGNGSAVGNASDNASIAPGAQLTGVVGVQKAKIEGEVESRGFEIALDRARGNASKAAVIASQVRDLNASLERLRERKAELKQARRNDSLDEGRYRARMAELVARAKTVNRLANRTENASEGIPAETLRQNGVNPNAIRELKRNARNLTGPGMAEIARSVAGRGVGKGFGRGPPEGAGPPDDNETGPPGNDNGPPDDNETGPPGNGNETGPPGNGNETGPPGNGNETGSPGNDSGPPGNDDDSGPTEAPGSIIMTAVAVYR